MSYDFTDSETLKAVDEALKLTNSEMSEEQLDLVIEYKSSVKAERLAANEYLEKLKDANSSIEEYNKKLSELKNKEFELKQKEVELMSRIADSDGD